VIKLIIFLIISVILPQASWAQCKVISIRSEKNINDRIYAQYGVGTVFSKSPDNGVRHIFTPAHVVNHADQITGRCGNNFFDLKIKGISVTSDMAVLEVTNLDASATKNYLEPLFKLDREYLAWPRTKSGSDSYVWSVPIGPESIKKTEIWSVQWGQEIESKPTPATEAKFNGIYESRPIIAVDYSIEINYGVRPGMSGSPVLDATNKKFIGVITKTQNYSSRSAGISMTSLKTDLPLLIEGNDKYGEKSKRGFYITDKLSVDINSNELVRYRVLHLKNKKGFEFTDACPNKIYTETTAWIEVGGKGEWSDGSGFKNNNYVRGKYWRGLFKGAYESSWSDSAIYRPTADDCKLQGVITSDGRNLIGLGYNIFSTTPDRKHSIEPFAGSFVETSNVDKLYWLLMWDGPKAIASFETYGKFADLAYRPISKRCFEKKLKNQNKMNAILHTSRDQLISDGETYDILSVNTWTPRTKTNEDVKIPISYDCNTEENIVSVRVTLPDVAISVLGTDERIKGLIQVGVCSAEFDQKAGTSIKTENMNFKVRFPEAGRSLLAISFYDIDKKCLSKESDPSKHILLDDIFIGY
jgi:hypothetical protein